MIGKHIYFARAEKTGLVKVGRSNSVGSRMAALEIKHGPIKLLTVVRSEVLFAEKYFHYRLSASRVSGEWFRITENDIVETIALFDAERPQISELSNVGGYRRHFRRLLADFDSGIRAKDRAIVCVGAGAGGNAA